MKLSGRFFFITNCGKEIENDLELHLSIDMPSGYETANGTFDIETKTVYINAEFLSETPDYEQAFFLYHELRHAMDNIDAAYRWYYKYEKEGDNYSPIYHLAMH